MNPLTQNPPHVNNSSILTISDTNKLANRSKGICEFVDITRNGAPKPNKEFIKVIKSNSFPFNRTKNVCSDMSILNHAYRNLCNANDK